MLKFGFFSRLLANVTPVSEEDNGVKSPSLFCRQEACRNRIKKERKIRVGMSERRNLWLFFMFGSLLKKDEEG